MSSDIIKQIILKFRGDTSAITRDMKQLEDRQKSLSKAFGGSPGSGTTSNTALNGMLQSMKTYDKALSKTGGAMNKDIGALQKTIRELATKDLNVMEQKLQKVAKRANDSVLKLAEMQKNGSSQEAINAQRVFAKGYTEKAGQIFNQVNSQKEALGVGTGNVKLPKSAIDEIVGSVLTAGTIISTIKSIASAPSMINDIRMEKLSNQSLVTKMAMSERERSYQGDMSTALLAQRGHLKRAVDMGKDREKSGKFQTSALLGGGLGLGIGATAAAIAAGTIALPATLAVGAVGLAGWGIKRMYTNESQKEGLERKEQVLNEARDSDAIVKQYQKFRQTAGRRASFMREFGVSDGADRITALASGMSEEDYVASASNLRGRLGGKAAAAMAKSAGYNSMEFGISKAGATDIIGSLGYGGTGGPNQGGAALKRILEEGISNGFDDPATREALAKGVAQGQDAIGSKTDSMELMKNLLGFMGGTSMRDIKGGVEAKDFSEAAFRGGKNQLQQSLFGVDSINTLRKFGLAPNHSNRMALESITEEEWRTGSEKARATAKMLGIDFDVLKKDQLGAGAERKLAGDPNKTAKSKIQALIKKGNITNDDLFSVGSDLAAISGEDTRGWSMEKIRGIARKQITDMGGNIAGGPGNLTEQEKQANNAKARLEKEKYLRSPEGIQARKEIEGGYSEAQDNLKAMKEVDLNKLYNAAKEAEKKSEINKTGDEANPEEASKNASKAMESFSDSLIGVTTALGGLEGYINRITGLRGSYSTPSTPLSTQKNTTPGHN